LVEPEVFTRGELFRDVAAHSRFIAVNPTSDNTFVECGLGWVLLQRSWQSLTGCKFEPGQQGHRRSRPHRWPAAIGLASVPYRTSAKVRFPGARPAAQGRLQLLRASKKPQSSAHLLTVNLKVMSHEWSSLAEVKSAFALRSVRDRQAFA
jgi:hypothetical protein